MNIRRRIIDYSRGNNLYYFWHLYRLQKKTGREEIGHDIITFLLSRCAHRYGGYIGSDTIIKNNLSLPHGLHGVFISRYSQIGENCCIYQNVTIGEIDRKVPVIGNNCLIGAGAVVNTNVLDNYTVVLQPMRMIEGEG